MSAVYGRGRWVFRIPDCRSLKDKRRVAIGLRDRLRSRLKVSAAETEYQGEAQKAEISIAFVSSDATVARRLLDRADEMIATDPRIYLIDSESELF